MARQNFPRWHAHGLQLIYIIWLQMFQVVEIASAMSSHRRQARLSGGEMPHAAPHQLPPAS
jgi:hypothetical protein